MSLAQIFTLMTLMITVLMNVLYANSFVFWCLVEYLLPHIFGYFWGEFCFTVVLAGLVGWSPARGLAPYIFFSFVWQTCLAASIVKFLPFVLFLFGAATFLLLRFVKWLFGIWWWFASWLPWILWGALCLIVAPRQIYDAMRDLWNGLGRAATVLVVAAREGLVLVVFALFVDALNLSYFLQVGVWPSINRHFRLAQRRKSLRTRVTRRMFFQNTKLVVTKISKVRLHDLVSRAYHAPSASAIQHGIDIMKDLGWPMNDKVYLSGDPMAFGRTKAASGVVRGQTFGMQLLDDLRKKYDVATYVFTGTYSTVENEYRSISRYFHGENKEWNPLPLLQDMWFLVAPLYENAFLTPTRVVINKFVKKYALGFGMVDGAGRKVKRAELIKQVGYRKFRQMWDRLAQNFAEIVPVTHVSVKLEYLKPAKFLLDKVRAICGAPLSHYAASRNIRFEQNHRSKPDTGIVVGMPLTGFYFGRLAAKHLMMDVHEAGDFADFDSTLNAKLNQLEAELSKRGFQGHDQYELIATILDIHTLQLDSMPLWTQSTGEIYEKPSGLTTGHGETTRKNSVALQALYLTAWKDLTGLSAHEFKRFNVLSNFGDDHILSYSKDAPVAWNFGNIQVALARYGVTLKHEATGSFYNLEFLSKCFRLPNAADLAALGPLGLRPATIVFHNREKLLGKLLADPKSDDPSYLLKRYHGYLQLTAHHPDIYEDIVKIIRDIHARYPNTAGKRIPTYNQLLSQWYNPSWRLQHIEDEGDWEHEAAVRTVSPYYIGIWFDWLSASIDVLNYRMLAAGPLLYFRRLLGRILLGLRSLLRTEILKSRLLLSSISL